MKNSTNKILTIAVLLLLAANLVMVYMMVKNKNRKGSRKEMRGDQREIYNALDLSGEQKKAYEQLKEDYFRNSKPLMDSVRAAKIAYFNLVKDSTVTDSLIQVYGDRVREKQAAADRITFDHFRNVRKIFTAEQQNKFDSLVKKMVNQRRRKN